MRFVRYILLALAVLGLLLIAMAVVICSNHGWALGGHGNALLFGDFGFGYFHTNDLGVYDPWTWIAAPYAPGFRASDALIRAFRLPYITQHSLDQRISVYWFPWFSALVIWELPLALLYLLAWRADRKYVLRRRRLAQWRASQNAFPVEMH